MDSRLFAKGPQMGNKMFVQLFNVKNIHFGAQILCLVWVSLSLRGADRGGQAAVFRGVGNPDRGAGARTGPSPGNGDVPGQRGGAALSSAVHASGSGPWRATQEAAAGWGWRKTLSPSFPLPRPPAGRRQDAPRGCDVSSRKG